MFITKKALNKIIDARIQRAFEKWGFEEAGFSSSYWGNAKIGHYPWDNSIIALTEDIKAIRFKLNLLVKHLKLEYYKKMISTDMSTTVEKGYRSIKKSQSK